MSIEKQLEFDFSIWYLQYEFQTSLGKMKVFTSDKDWYEKELKQREYIRVPKQNIKLL